ncbi:MAG: hypothetical protein N0E48_16080 [Candidatus Thiodiazotropha endolucinida]|nr:hypothetical protein [Candidatus Thiodiazotropha taylori]MCW4344850.1 hypothetical protein [Candidatus Thiodiazotropha endolucinida]
MNLIGKVTTVLFIALLGGCTVPSLRDSIETEGVLFNGCLNADMRESQMAEMISDRTRRVEFAMISEAIRLRNFPLDYDAIYYDALSKVMEDMKAEIRMMEQTLYRARSRIQYEGNDLENFQF